MHEWSSFYLHDMCSNMCDMHAYIHDLHVCVICMHEMRACLLAYMHDMSACTHAYASLCVSVICMLACMVVSLNGSQRKWKHWFVGSERGLQAPLRLSHCIFTADVTYLCHSASAALSDMNLCILCQTSHQSEFCRLLLLRHCGLFIWARIELYG